MNSKRIIQMKRKKNQIIFKTNVIDLKRFF